MSNWDQTRVVPPTGIGTTPTVFADPNVAIGAQKAGIPRFERLRIFAQKLKTSALIASYIVPPDEYWTIAQVLVSLQIVNLNGGTLRVHDSPTVTSNFFELQTRQIIQPVTIGVGPTPLIEANLQKPEYIAVPNSAISVQVDCTPTPADPTEFAACVIDVLKSARLPGATV